MFWTFFAVLAINIDRPALLRRVRKKNSIHPICHPITSLTTISLRYNQLMCVVMSAIHVGVRRRAKTKLLYLQSIVLPSLRPVEYTRHVYIHRNTYIHLHARVQKYICKYIVRTGWHRKMIWLEREWLFVIGFQILRDSCATSLYRSFFKRNGYARDCLYL